MAQTSATTGYSRRPPSAPDISAATAVILPTYREAATIGAVLQGLRASLPRATVLVVDDEGEDGTADRAEEAAGCLGGIEVLRRPAKRGLADAYRHGFRVATERNFDAVVGMDADGSHDAADLPRLLSPLAAGADVVIGSRYVPGGRTVAWPWHRRALSRMGNSYASWALRIPVHDVTSAFRAYRMRALAAAQPDSTEAHGYGFLVELAYRLHCAGARFAEIPIEFRNRDQGKSKMTAAIAAEAFAIVTSRAVAARAGRRT